MPSLVSILCKISTNILRTENKTKIYLYLYLSIYEKIYMCTSVQANIKKANESKNNFEAIFANIHLSRVGAEVTG